MTKISQKIYFLISGLFFITGGIVFYQWISSYNSREVMRHLQIISPLFLEIDFFLIILFIVINAGVFKRVFGGIPKKISLSFRVILVVGMLITIFGAPRDHRLYYDEDIYQNIGQNIAFLRGPETYSGQNSGNSLVDFLKRFAGRAAMCNEGEIKDGEYRCFRMEYNKEPNAWPYLLSVVYSLFGVDELASFFTNNFIYGLSVLTVFFIGYLLFKDPLAGIYGALIFSLIPELMMWSNTTAVEPGTALFAGLTFLSVLIYLQSREIKSLYLVAVTAVFASQFRPESIMILGVIGLALLLWRDSDLFKRGDFYLLLSIAFILIIPHLAHTYAVKNMSWGSEGVKMSTDFFRQNFEVNFFFYFKNNRFPLLFTALFILGIILKQGLKKGDFFWKEKLVLLTWFLLFWGIFLFFYAGRYNNGVQVRYSLLSYMPIALLAGNGTAALAHNVSRQLNFKYTNYILFFIIILTFLSFLSFVKALTEEAWGARFDHRFAKEMAKTLPDESLVLTHNPNMFLLWGKSAAQNSLATGHPETFKNLTQRYRGGIYFHYNFWCNVPDPVQNSFCTNLLEQFRSTRQMIFTKRNFKYMLYKIEIKN